MKSKAHTCPECGENLPLDTFLTLPGEFRIKCPHCKSTLQPTLNDFHKADPLILFIIIIFSGINQRSGFTTFVIYIGVLTLLTYIILVAGAYFFLRFKKVEEKEE